MPGKYSAPEFDKPIEDGGGATDVPFPVVLSHLQFSSLCGNVVRKVLDNHKTCSSKRVVITSTMGVPKVASFLRRRLTPSFCKKSS